VDCRPGRPGRRLQTTAVQQNKQNDDKGEAKTSPFTIALEHFRYTDNATTADDAAQLSQGLQIWTTTSASGNHFPASARCRGAQPFLIDVAHLSERELTEVESTSFRQADAYHLDECFCSRMPLALSTIPGAGPMEQAQFQFRWVHAQFMLHEQSDDWIPPAFTLRRGHGGPLERALVVRRIASANAHRVRFRRSSGSVPHRISGHRDAQSLDRRTRHQDREVCASSIRVWDCRS